jgi:hypothetical protein
LTTPKCPPPRVDILCRDPGQHPVVLCQHKSSYSLLQVMLYNTRRVRPYLTHEVLQVLVQALVISHLDYCNSMWSGLPLVPSNPCNYSRMLQPTWCSTFPSFPMSPHSSAHSTGFQPKLESTTRP